MAVFPVPLLATRRPKVSSSFGPRGDKTHYGVDVMYPRVSSDPAGLPTSSKRHYMPADVPALAYDDGIVVKSELIGTGHHVQLQHEGGIATQYFHLADRRVRVGERVQAGQPVGMVWHNPAGYRLNHLHFQVRLNGQRVDPAPYLQHAVVVKEPPSMGAFVAKVALAGVVAWGVYKLLR